MTDKYEALRNTAKRDLVKDNYTTEEPRVILALLAERDELLAERDEWCTHAGEYADDLVKVKAERDALAAQVDELRHNSDRFLWSVSSMDNALTLSDLVSANSDTSFEGLLTDIDAVRAGEEG